MSTSTERFDWPVDMMLNDDGTYACALWCESGSVTIRGNICEECQVIERELNFQRQLARIENQKEE